MIGLKVTINQKDVATITRRLRPEVQRRVLSRALTEIALRVARNAATEQIIRGGRFKVGSKLTNASVDPKRVTSRSGRLRASIAGEGFKRGINDSRLPSQISVGSDVIYAPVHELGSATTRARPFLRPAFEAIFPQMDEILKKHWERELS